LSSTVEGSVVALFLGVAVVRFTGAEVFSPSAARVLDAFCDLVARLEATLLLSFLAAELLVFSLLFDEFLAAAFEVVAVAEVLSLRGTRRTELCAWRAQVATALNKRVHSTRVVIPKIRFISCVCFS
jgi:hypothetical protein